MLRSSWWRRSVCLHILFVCVLTAGPARADGACEQALGPALKTCTTEATLAAHACPPGRLIVQASFVDNTPPLAIELQPGARHGFRLVGDVALSPVGEFPQWRDAPQPYRKVVDQLATCLHEHPGLLTGQPKQVDSSPASIDSKQASAPPSYPTPWLALLAACVLAVCTVMRPRSPGRLPQKQLLRLFLAIGGLAAAWLVRHNLYKPMYLHQNGQGPLWTEAAVSDPAGLFRYGPGYGELLNPAVLLLPNDPDAAIFIAIGLASLVLPYTGFIVARHLGATRGLAWAVAIILTVAPVPVRLAASESYFAVGLILVAIASALAVRGTHLAAFTRKYFMWIHLIGAGLVVSLMARVHPLLWLPATSVLVPIWLQRGRLRDRAWRTTKAATVIALVVGVTSGRQMISVIQGSLGQQWLPDGQAGLELVLPHPLLWLALLVVAAAAWRRRSRLRSLELIVLTIILGCLATSTNLVAANYPWIADAYLWLFVPAWLALVVAGLRDIRPRWSALVGLAAVAAVTVFLRTPTILVETTDATELNLAGQWRTQLPDSADLIWLARAGERTLNLPVYTHFPIHARPWTAGNAAPAVHRSSPTFYYRSSLCSTPEGHQACAAFEANHELTPELTWELDAISSLPWLELPHQPIAIGLFRVAPQKHVVVPASKQIVDTPNPPHVPVTAPPAPAQHAEHRSHDPHSPIKTDEQVVLFPALANLHADGQRWQVPIHGWVFEWEDDDILRNSALDPLTALMRETADDGQLNTSEIRERLQWFVVDNERGKSISVELAGRSWPAGTSGADGHFSAVVELPRDAVDPERGGQKIMYAQTRPGDDRVFATSVHFVPPRATLVISDIDDTVRDSRVTDKTELLRRTFLYPYTPVVGMPGFVRGLVENQAHLHFVSASPWQLYPQLDSFLQTNGLPQATYSLKQIRLKDTTLLKLFEDPFVAKVATIEGLLARFPGAGVVLVGDSGEHDPEVYGELARRHPEQVRHIYIRLAPGGPLDANRRAHAFAGVPAHKVDVFAAPP